MSNYQELSIPSCFSYAKEAEDRVVEVACEQGYDQEDIFALRLSIEEALANAIRHGNGQDKNKTVNLRYFVDSKRVDIYISDQGSGFDPGQVPDPTTEENLDVPSGRGIMLMRAYMNLVEYNETGNVVHMVKLNNTNDMLNTHEKTG